jgi:hypothetical protein
MRQSLRVPDHCTDDAWLKTNGLLVLHTAWRESDGPTACTDELSWACGDSTIPAWCECQKREAFAPYAAEELRAEVTSLKAALAGVLIIGPLGVVLILLGAYVLKLNMHVSIERIDPSANIADVEHADEIERKIMVECPGADKWTYEENGLSLHLCLEGKKLHIDQGSSPRGDQGFAFDAVRKELDFRWSEPFQIREDRCKLENGILMVIVTRRKKRGGGLVAGALPSPVCPAEQHTIYSDVFSEGTHAETEESFENVSDHAVAEHFLPTSANSLM